MKMRNLSITGPCEGDPPVTGGFQSQCAIIEQSFMPWRHMYLSGQPISNLILKKPAVYPF